MASLVSDADKATWGAEFMSLHETFGRDCVIYKLPERVDIVTNDDYISTYRDAQQGANYQFDSIPVSGTFQMRVKWVDPNKELNSPLDSHLPGMLCRLKMTPEAYNFLGGQQSFYVDGISCELVGTPQPHGLFAVDFYTLYARRRDMQ